MKCTHTYGKCLPGERGLSARSLRRALLHVSKHALHHGLVKGAVGEKETGQVLRFIIKIQLPAMCLGRPHSLPGRVHGQFELAVACSSR